MPPPEVASLRRGLKGPCLRSYQVLTTFPFVSLTTGTSNSQCSHFWFKCKANRTNLWIPFNLLLLSPWKSCRTINWAIGSCPQNTKVSINKTFCRNFNAPFVTETTTHVFASRPLYPCEAKYETIGSASCVPGPVEGAASKNRSSDTFASDAMSLLRSRKKPASRIFHSIQRTPSSQTP